MRLQRVSVPLLLLLLLSLLAPFARADIHTLEVDDTGERRSHQLWPPPTWHHRHDAALIKSLSGAPLTTAPTAIVIWLTETDAMYSETYIQTSCPIKAVPERNVIQLWLSANGEFTTISRGANAMARVSYGTVDGKRVGKVAQNESSAVFPNGTKSIVIEATAQTEFMYDVAFFNCHNLMASPTGVSSVPYSAVSMKLHIEQYNLDASGNRDYLSASESPLPIVLVVTSVCFVCAAILWTGILVSRRNMVFKIHYLMLVLVFLKACSSFSLAMRDRTLQTEGTANEAWQVFYYIFRFARTGLFFVAIAMIGAGFTFIKFYLSAREKYVLAGILGLQLLSNSASIISEELDVSDQMHAEWNRINKMVNIISCGVVLVMIMWSIKHLHSSIGVDGKANRALPKLKLFRYLYAAVFIYVFLNEIFVELLRLALPFKYEWLAKLFEELLMLGFFIWIGVHFRPGADNPYLQVSQDDDDEEIAMDTIVTTNEGANPGGQLTARNTQQRNADD
ncbi:lung seven transmembrane receptor [Capsaspora owczarzaki ATCC 30864]|uniref:Lung seven transmembrane receptor n=1 Tax=Capsaspora owczarzaki (strain ATCC 30864) TaxID=595528 RepID=A0A0D2WR42_CAPO3|nr:lung seven transmembrane receptor [Capsaspora owczarzaki ATCC 30864]KJE93588.1 lung seven transmembrane receptor [Capsaspora owczarzaki ATCC 30864]|eukprot:XP_004348180.2 lung seven transmembrane receptor [Capsaspora owczarzaki ATCC 30864]